MGSVLHPQLLPSRSYRRNHHRQPRNSAGHQLRQARQPSSHPRPLFEFRAAAGVCDAGELKGLGGGHGGGAVSAHRVDVGEGGVGGEGARVVLAIGLHRHLLRRRLAGFSRLAEAWVYSGFLIARGHSGIHGGSGDGGVPAAIEGIMGLEHFTTSTDLISVLRSIFSQVHQWKWESVVLDAAFLSFLLATRILSKRRAKFFWLSAAAPLTSVVLGSLLVYLSHAESHGVQVIGHLKKGLNPLSLTGLIFSPPHMILTLKTGMITGIIALAEGIAVGRSFAMFKNYHIDGNKEMIAFGAMNIAGSLTSCYLTTGPFSRSAVNYNAGCKTAMSNVVMAVAVMITLLLLTPLFHYTPLVVLSSIILSAMLGLIDYEAAFHLLKVDKVDFCVCIGTFLGVVFGNVEIGLVVAVLASILRVLLFIARPRTTILGNIPNSMAYRRIDQYPGAQQYFWCACTWN
ncbi:Sulfate transporter 3.1 [Platanthera guangdongensis]|uniref:Sulfate transporter 3.1 n=1 Tax=Platanthera guangdongensis TaxID=2320717 RepID=A0ABR2M2I9_9ASPA